MALIPLLHLHSMSSVTFCFDTLDTFCDVSAFLVVIESQPGMDVKIPELRKETVGTAEIQDLTEYPIARRSPVFEGIFIIYHSPN